MYTLIDSIKIQYLNDNSLVLDIETTGVSRLNSKVVVAGVLDNSGKFIQFAIENDDEEKKLLERIFPILNDKHIITFNGQNFDIPFLKERFKFHGLKSFTESSQFDIYRFLISNKHITNYDNFSLREVEKIKDLERNENFDIEEDILFYKDISDMDISKILIHNKYDVINTESILSIVNDINKSKIVIFSYKNLNIEAIIDEIILDKNILEVSCSLPIIDIEYRFEDDKYYLDWSNNFVKFKFVVMEGYFDDNTLGLAHILNKESKINDSTNFNLPEYIIPVFANKYYLENIKSILQYIFEKFMR